MIKCNKKCFFVFKIKKAYLFGSGNFVSPGSGSDFSKTGSADPVKMGPDPHQC